MPIHQFKGKPNKYGKKHLCGNRTQDLLVPKFYPTPKMPLGYKVMGSHNVHLKVKFAKLVKLKIKCS
ncbi:hypothetical protein Hanom_Chr03g00182621 [Helianthus anomalus]